ncbi:50S ribosomal protein L23 [Buchnera aphidicola (Ceratovacuna keduensis)]|uniref:50S ribosomal protein L23 n=1 Tax=Buchnera aphidicola TaxID=9 RepID=UPI0031B8090B
MKFKERNLKIFRGIHISEKSSIISEKKNSFIIKVLKNANKKEIKNMLEKIFKVNVLKINTLIVKGKKKNNRKGNSNKYGFKKDWKKVYITLKKGDSFNF